MSRKSFWNPDHWEWIPGYEDQYAISDEGVILSFSRRKPIVLKVRQDKDGYFEACLCRNNKLKYARVHRLVLLAFVGPPPSEQHVGMHKNNVNTDNRLCNLTWGTVLENTRQAVEDGLIPVGSAHHNNTGLTEEVVIQIREKYSKRPNKRTYSGISHLSLAREYGVSEATIAQIVNRRTWNHM